MIDLQQMSINPPKQSLAVRAVAWYLKDFPICRGKGLVNRILGKFLQVEVFGGIKLRLINPLEFHQKILLFADRVYEPQVIKLLTSALGEGAVFFDIGANMGYHTLLVSKRIGSRGRVHAFEPAPSQFAHLKLNTELNRADNIVLNNLAVADSSGDREFFISEGWNQGTHSLGKTAGQESTCRVACISIDEYADKAGVNHIDAIKVDVEGGELFVFKGAERILSSSPPPLLIFEACEEFVQSFGYSTSDLKQAVERFGYTCYKIEDSLQPIQVSSASKEYYANIVAIHSNAEERYYRALEAACDLSSVYTATEYE